MIIDNNILKSTMERMNSIEINSSRSSYEIDGKRVPRVTEILSSMLHEDGLMGWANSLGWKRISYRAFMKESSDKGTYSHLAIEKFIKSGNVNISDMNIVSDNIRNTVISCLDGFKLWWEKLHKEHNNIELIYLEETLIHPYFGGTCDCLLKVDGEYWLIDFKTSNHMSYKYSLQLAAYRFLLKELKGIIVNKCIVLRVSKTDHNYSDYVLDLSNKDHLTFIEDCEQTFMILTIGFIMRMKTTEDYYKIYNITPYKH